MKVAIVDPSCLTWPYTPMLCEAIAKNGCEVHLVASQFLYSNQEHSGSFRRWNHFYTRTTSLFQGRSRGYLRNCIKGSEHVVDMFRLVRFLQWLKPDVIHFQIAPIPVIDRWFVPTLGHIAPTISTVHNSIPFHGEASRFQLLGFGSFLSQFFGLIVHAENSRKILIKTLKIPKERIFLIPHGKFDQYQKIGITDSSSSNSDISANRKSGDRIILFFGNISYYKGLDILIRAVGGLDKNLLKSVRLAVYGNPQIPIEPLKALAEDSKISDRINWDLRYIADEEIHLIFKEASVVVLPHRYVDGSGVLATALTYAKPIVATRVGEFAEILQHGVHGYLVNPEDPHSMTVALESILSNQEKAESMGRAVHQLGESRWSWDMVGKETVRLYDHLVQRNVAKDCGENL